MTDYLRHKWQLLRLYKSKHSFMYDYKILQNFSHLMKWRTL
ncbi:YlcG family protein [Erwinia endophytica]|nr:YlcG family protein [Erwinia endophytica]KAB8312944.1 YlcG family protein [Erwinia endophytica]